MMEVLIVVFSAIFVNNILLSRYLGNCPFCGVSKNIDSALGMGIAVLFVLTIASAVTWMVHHYLLAPFNLTYLQTIVFILIIATLVQLVELFLQKNAVTLYQSLGIYLPLITTNCAVLGVAILAVRNGYGFFMTVLFAVASAIGFLVALLCMAGIRLRLELTAIPKAFQGTAVTLIIAGLMALAFYGFSGMDESLSQLVKLK
ncbi:MAG: RnfABCDGE type electron transport complex subunit A [Chitinispirillaceae bacterium]|nr:RnfABCDGE type electron transport complex subunit A [Chitinispirillaceae bacterium]